MAKLKERSMGKDVSHMDAYISDILYFIFYIIVNFGTLFGSVELPIFKMGLYQRVRRLVTWSHTIASYYIIATADLDRFPGSIAE